MAGKKKRIAQQLKSAALRAKLKPLTHKERIARARKDRERAKAAAERTLTAAGLAPKFAAKLQVAAKTAATDPEARALLEQARLAKRIEIAKRENSVGNPALTPTRFMGASVKEYEAAVDSPAKIPPRLSDVRKPAEGQKRSKR